MSWGGGFLVVCIFLVFSSACACVGYDFSPSIHLFFYEPMPPFPEEPSGLSSSSSNFFHSGIHLQISNSYAIFFSWPLVYRPSLARQTLPVPRCSFVSREMVSCRRGLRNFQLERKMHRLGSVRGHQRRLPPLNTGQVGRAPTPEVPAAVRDLWRLWPMWVGAGMSGKSPLDASKDAWCVRCTRWCAGEVGGNDGFAEVAETDSEMEVR